MLKKLVIVGSLLAVGPLLAGCPGGVVFGVTQVAAPLLVAGVEALDNTSSTSAANRVDGQKLTKAPPILKPNARPKLSGGGWKQNVKPRPDANHPQQQNLGRRKSIKATHNKK